MLQRTLVPAGRRIGVAICLFAVTLFAVSSLSGCGGKSTPATVSVAVTASAATVDGTNTVTLTAAVTNDKNSAGVTWTVTGGGTLSGQTTTGATYTAPAASSSALTVTVTATSVTESTKTGTATLTVPAAPAITSPTAAQLTAAVGTAYSLQLAGTGGIAPYTWKLTGGTLPTGWTLTAAGLLSGPAPVAGQAGTVNLTFQVTDSGTPTALTASLPLVVTINPAPAIAFTTASLAAGTYHVPYSATVAATGGAGALTYSLSSGSLPTGMSFSAGAISGTPAAVGTFPISVTAADAFGDSVTQKYSIVVSYAALAVATASLPTGYVNSAYSTTLLATGGTGTGYVWTLTSALPAGLTLSPAGTIVGTPTAMTPASFTVSVTDSASNPAASATLPITIKPAITITTPITLPVGYVGSSYSLQMTAAGGSGTGYTWTLATGSSNPLPAGLTLSASGLLSGKPTTAGGPTSVSITVTDSASNTTTVAMSITISPGITITPTPLPTGYQGTAYPATTLTATGGSGTGYTWSWVAASGSSLPAGLNLSTTGAITGTPTAGGAFNVTITVTDSVGNTASTSPTLTVQATLAISTAATLSGAVVGAPYSNTLAATGGSGGYTWATNTAGTASLATINLTLSAGGVVSGTPAGQGTATFAATVTDSASHTATVTFTVSASNALTVTTTSLPAVDAGVAYSQQLAAAGGSGTGYTWTATSSNLTSYGLSLSSTGAITGTVSQSGTAAFTANVTDSASNTAKLALTITVNGALSLPAPNPTSLGSATTNQDYSGTIVVSGGSGSGYVWTVTNLPSDSLSSSTSGATLTVTGLPTTATTVSFTASVKDSTGNSVGPFTYTVAVNPPAPLVLPSPNPTSLGSATANQSYSGAINASGGSGSGYVFTVNGTDVPTNSTPLTLTDGLSATNSGGNTLSVAGTPTTAQTVSLIVSVKDGAGDTAGPTTYNLVVNPPGAQVSGQISLNNSCGGSSGNMPAITVNISTSPGGTLVQSTTADNNGNYSFAGVAAGTYTVTPSIAGPSSVFYPATQTATLSGSNVTDNFYVSLGYTVSGTVTYNTSSGSPQTGQTYLVLNGGCGNGEPGTSITETTLTSGGAFTIRGVPPGSYTLQAWMDPLGQGVQNAIDPTGSSSVTVTNANVTNAAVTMTNPTFATPTSNPTINGIVPNAQGVFIEYSRSRNSGGTEDANQYMVQWSTSPTLGGGSGGDQFATIAGSHAFTAIGEEDVWVLNNAVVGAGTFTSGQTYYFQARSFDTLDTANPHPSGWCNYTSSGCGGTTGFVGVTIGTPACTGTCTSVSSSVTIPAGIAIKAGAPLYLGLIQLSSSSGGNPVGFYFTEISSPATGANDFTVTVPSGSNYAVVGILDQNLDGGLGAGAVTNVRQNVQGNLTIAGSTQTVLGIALPTANSAATVTTQYYSSTYSGGSSTSYDLNFEVGEGNKLPVAVTLTAGPNVIDPVDIGNYCQGCGNQQFQYSSTIPVGTPNVGDTYDFTVTYSDGSQDTGTTVNGAVTGWNGTSSVVGASDLATNLSPSGSGAGTTPTFTWTYPASAGSYFYSFYLCCTNSGDIWDIPSNNSKSNGFTSAVTKIVWGTDPTGDAGNTPAVPSLTGGTTYSWQLQVQDSNGNQANAQANFEP